MDAWSEAIMKAGRGLPVSYESHEQQAAEIPVLPTTTIERLKNSMLINVAITEKATALATVEQNKSEQIIVPPVAVVAPNAVVAIALVAAANADKVKAANPDLLQIHTREGL